MVDKKRLAARSALSASEGDHENETTSIDRLLVSVDPSICIGARNCVRVASGAFGFDDYQQIAKVTNPSSVAEERLRLAERSCPTGAIFVENS